jgi:formiminotetrahydrofolate cyclodeaminase
MTPLRSLRLDGFLDQLGSRTPAPGGGAAASIAGATGAALARMVVEYSLGKKALAEHQPALGKARESLLRLAAMFLQLADEDAEAYGLVNELSRLPETDPRRTAEFAAAAAAAVAAPRAVLAACCDLLRLLEALAPITNRHLRSDLAIAAILAEAGARAARWNIVVNLPLIGDEGGRVEIDAESRREVEDAAARRGRVEAACAS